MKEVLVNLSLPVIQKVVDVYLPIEVPVRDLKNMMIKALSEISGGAYRISGEECLTRPDTGTIMQDEHSLKDYQIKNGDHLMLL